MKVKKMNIPRLYKFAHKHQIAALDVMEKSNKKYLDLINPYHIESRRNPSKETFAKLKNIEYNPVVIFNSLRFDLNNIQAKVMYFLKNITK